MREAKRRRLESKGWKVGNAKDFLDLSPEESAYIEMKLELAECLRVQRERRKLTQMELAKLVNSSQSRVAKMEAGDPSVSMDLLVRSLLALGAPKRKVAKIISPKRVLLQHKAE
jgi:DNA-binding XRE family transcriptional regulator